MPVHAGVVPVVVREIRVDAALVWLKEHGVDTESVHVSADRRTARFMCMTDQAQNQMASFYTVTVPAVQAGPIADPTGVGDAFRAGFLAAVGRGLEPAEAARFGCALAVLALESIGPQEYTVARSALLPRIEAAYGPVTAQEVDASGLLGSGKRRPG
ncbi:PfkB family carbohydrate kinase [Streptomyces wuyuanensis]|uniref:PfkB family carbohydrate kinase n=1 Tax=Streptomyces wuyuanensis TaxID=1196353 RepID=UPI003D75A768